jgi:hypothetical protein
MTNSRTPINRPTHKHDAPNTSPIIRPTHAHDAPNTPLINQPTHKHVAPNTLLINRPNTLLASPLVGTRDFDELPFQQQI